MSVDPISAAASLIGAQLPDGVEAYAHDLPDDVAGTEPVRCVVVAASGGPGSGGFLPHGDQRLDLKFFARTTTLAMDDAIAISAYLKGLRRTVHDGVLFRSFKPSSGYVSLRDPELRWPLVLRTFLAGYDERAVA